MTLQLIGDKTLVRMYRAGDDRALAELIRRYKDKVFTSIMLFVKDDVLAEDIFQDTYIKVIETLRRGKYSEEGKFLPWVLRIAYNLCVDHYRRTKRTPTITTSDGQDLFKVIKFAEENAEENIERNETADKVRKLIDSLPPEQREVVILRHYADLSFKEIAAITDVSINTALGRMRYALINMRKLVEEKQIAL
ncbi:MAG TPA: sigma-70 family RNA polymerase sigma factor [Chitinophagales bacterium]|nr:sigma-70 family RNA polymerase sigma factor [Chitinophagales bacterium]HRK29079.1 sigma-70 family RNA polymerase sigma factor [Chitinophagales bacterium]